MTYNFWSNVYKFPRFLISIIIGFFLITLRPIFRLLNNKKKATFTSIIIIAVMIILYLTLRLMTGTN